MRKTKVVRTEEVFEFDQSEIEQLLKEAIIERHFLGGQLGTDNKVEIDLDTFGQSPTLTVRLITETQENES